MTQPTPKHVIVVDDDPDYAHLTAETLRGAGFRVTVFHDARAAAGFVVKEASTVDLVVTDVMMDYLVEGFDLARLLRTHPDTHEVRIVILTGARRVFDAAAEAGEDWYPCDVLLEKPIEAHELIGGVCSLLRLAEPHH